MKNVKLPVIVAFALLLSGLIGFWFFTKNEHVANKSDQSRNAVDRNKPVLQASFEDLSKKSMPAELSRKPPTPQEQRIVKVIPKEETREVQEKKNQYRHQDREGFDIGVLGGTLDMANSYYRDDFYATLDNEIMQRQMANPSEDRTEDLIEQFETTIDYALGVEYPEEKRDVLRDIKRKAHGKYVVLDELLEKGKITETQYTDRKSIAFEERLKRSSDGLTPEEFEALFEIKKDEIAGSYTRFMQMLALGSSQNENNPNLNGE